MDGNRLKFLLGVWGDGYLIYDLSMHCIFFYCLGLKHWALHIFLLLRVKTLSIHIGRSYGTYQEHKTSAIGTTDFDAMEFIPLK